LLYNGCAAPTYLGSEGELQRETSEGPSVDKLSINVLSSLYRPPAYLPLSKFFYISLLKIIPQYVMLSIMFVYIRESIDHRCDKKIYYIH
jgi:hypothetical protein